MSEYRLLQCVDCAVGFSALVGARGAPRKRCTDCSPSQAGAPSQAMFMPQKCPVCTQEFIGRPHAKYCSNTCRVKAGNDAQRLAELALHRAAAVARSCRWCAAKFCPLFGQSNVAYCSAECGQHSKNDQRNQHRRWRKAKETAGLKLGRFTALSVLQRDRWHCRFCEIETPEALRGTHEHNAPELDHVVPLARGGEHSYENTQCLCRACNGFKSNRTMDELEQVLGV